MKHLTIFFALTILVTAQERYSQVEIPVRSLAEYQRIADLGLAVDHFDGKIGDRISVILSKTELGILDGAGIQYTVQINDWERFYKERVLHSQYSPTQSAVDTLKYFRKGSKGGFLTLAEMEYDLWIMKQYYSWLISEKIEIGVTAENRKIYAVKISDNPDIDEPDEPEVLYTAMHHAREPQGMMTLMYYMYWLLEKYNKKDPDSRYLVDNRQMWFILVVNPDGYEFNDAGGMWRKNRRINSDGSYGVDLNRNYGPQQMWNSPNGGSSTTPNSDTYRGTEPFSEQETFAVSQFMAKHKIRTCLNYHTYGNYLIYPWGYSSKESDDSLKFRYWASELTRENRYNTGTDMQTVGYSTRGNSDDFMYGDTGKSKTYAFTPEVGRSGFWPHESEIFPLAFENLQQNKLIAYYAGGYPGIESYSVKNDVVTVNIINKGSGQLKNTAIMLTTNTGIVTPIIYTGDLQPFEKNVISFSLSALSVDGPASVPVKIYLKDSSNALMRDSIMFIVGKPDTLLYDQANSTSFWSTGTSWGTFIDPLTGDSSFADSPTGNYAMSSNNSLTLVSEIDLSKYQYAELRFMTKWAIEPVWDFGFVEISTNGGLTWLNVRTRLSKKGSGRPSQPVTSYGYDGYTPGLTWTEQRADLTPYVAKKILVRFRLIADSGDQRDGIYLDDIAIFGYTSTPNSVQPFSSPFSFSLSQNFPNPFNPTTTIRFTVQQLGRTSLHIYNSIGQLVTTLVDKELAAGAYSINFDAKQLSSGLYFYRFTSGTFTDVKKMTVVK